MKLDALIILASIAAMVTAEVPRPPHNPLVAATHRQPSLADSLFSMRAGAGIHKVILFTKFLQCYNLIVST